MRFDTLFEPVNIGKLQIKNRIAMAGMATHWAEEYQSFTERSIKYYTERAIGGVGLIIPGAMRIKDIEPIPGYMVLGRESFASFSELAEMVHYYGAKIFAQLTPGHSRNTAGSLIDSGLRPFSSSEHPTYWRPNVMTTALNT